MTYVVVIFDLLLTTRVQTIQQLFSKKEKDAT